VSTLPPVLLVHGLASSFEHGWRQSGWVDLLEDAGRDVIPFDLPGHGSARELAGAPAAASLLAAVADLEQVDAVGFSAGGHAVLAAAAAEPERFRRIAVLGVGDPGEHEADVREQIATAIESDQEPEEPFVRVLRRLATTTGNDRSAVAAALRVHPRGMDLQALAAITCSVLVVLGERDPAAPADRLIASLPDARLVPLPGVDHFSTPTQMRCLDVVLTFLAEPSYG
jgi:pimeloyl-ACP methyl ester carboxylesterase